MAQLTIEAYRPVGEFVWEHQANLGQYSPGMLAINVLHDGGSEFHTLECESDGRSSVIMTSRRGQALTVRLGDGQSKVIFQRNPGDFMPTAWRLTHRS